MYRPALALVVVATLTWLGWRFLMTAVWCIVALPLSLSSLLLVFGVTCGVCNSHIWPWEKSTDARYTDNLDFVHQRCCTERSTTGNLA
jgi:hypothetical protein